MKAGVKIPHTNRPKCIACDRTIRSSVIHYLSTNLLRVFVSIEQRKRVTASDVICDSCRSRYNRWKQMTMGDFNQLDIIDSNYVQFDAEVHEKNDIVILILFEYSTWCVQNVSELILFQN